MLRLPCECLPHVLHHATRVVAQRLRRYGQHTPAERSSAAQLLMVAVRGVASTGEGVAATVDFDGDAVFSPGEVKAPLALCVETEFFGRHLDVRRDER